MTAPILGPRRLDHLTANLAALDLDLTEAQLSSLDEVSRPQLNYPYDLNRQTGAMLHSSPARRSTVWPRPCTHRCWPTRVTERPQVRVGRGGSAA